ncbi:hypothetical protein EV361DRAFT_575251 [Lentinula raphanica]|nr:hypothetical protein EV361DRAFT_575251 [Lentinula raphanica]
MDGWDASVAGLVEAYDFMKTLDGQDLVKKAWAKSTTAKGYNLSAECLTSKHSVAALNAYLRSDKTLYDEIEQRCGQVLGISDESAVEADTDFHGDIQDDVDVAFSDVVADTFKENSPRTETGLVSSAEEEDIWAYDDNGNLWSKTGFLPETEQ